MTRLPLSKSKGQRSRSLGSFTHRGVNASGICSGERGQWLKWSCEAVGAHLTKPGRSNPIPIPHPTNLAYTIEVGLNRSRGLSNPIRIPHPTNLSLFGHKITLYRFFIDSIRGLILLKGLKSEQGAEPPRPLHFKLYMHEIWSVDSQENH